MSDQELKVIFDELPTIIRMEKLWIQKLISIKGREIIYWELRVS